MRNQVESVQNPEKSVRNQLKIGENPAELVKHHLKIPDKSARHNTKICKLSLQIRENPRDIPRISIISNEFQ